MPGPKFEKGENVYGLWPGSGGLYFKGTVVATDEDYATYDVKFEEGTVYTLLSKHVKAVESFKSQEPKSTQVRRRGRSSSASRSRSRSRTPGRKPKDTSPPPKRKDSSPVTKTRRPGRPSKQQKEKEEKKNEDAVKTLPEDVDEMSLSKRQEIMPTKLESNLEEEVQSRRRSARIATKVEAIKAEPVLNPILENGNGPTESVQQESTQDEEKESENDEKSEILMDKKSTMSSLILAICFPVLVLFLLFICQDNECNFQNWPSIDVSKLTTLYDPNAFVYIGGLYLCVILLSLLPFGEIATLDSYIVAHRQNGLMTALAIFLPTVLLKHYYQFQVSPFIHLIPRLVLPVIILSLIFSLIVLFINRRNDTESGIISKFVLGTSVDVSIGRLSVKSVLNRLAAITLISINYVLIEADYEQNNTFALTLTLVTSMQIIYGLNDIWSEMENLHTVAAGRLNVGWTSISYTLLYPFFVSLITLYSSTQRTELPLYCLAPIGILFIEGLFIKVGSNRQKAAFNKNPENPLFAHVESLSTSSGRKLLISGWWGWVRHPNSLGDIVIHWAFALSCGFHVALPYVVAVIATAAFLVGVYADDRLCRREFGPSWDRYCQRVTSRVFPRLL